MSIDIIPNPITGDEYRSLIAKLGLNQVTAAKLFRADPRTSRRWVKDGPPHAVGICLRMMVFYEIGVAEVERLMATNLLDGN